MTMKSKSTLKCLSSINNSRSCTQDMKSLNSAKQWVGILEGIDAIASKVKEISGQGVQNYGSQKCGGKHEVSKSTTRVNTTFDCSRSKSRKRTQKKPLKTSKVNSACIRDISQKLLKRMLYDSSYRQPQQKQRHYDSRVSQKRITIEPACETRCHQVMAQMSQLKKINDQLIRKNQELERKLRNQKEERSKQKVQRQRTNQIVLRVIKQNQEDSMAICGKDPQSISIQLKPHSYYKFPNENHSIRLSPRKKPQKQPQTKSRVLNLSKQKRGSAMESATESLHKSKPSELKNLETQFDRLMEISYLERNKARKRVIWDQMKSIANQLKMMRYFTQN